MYNFILNNIAKHIQLSPAESELFTSLLTHKILKRKEFLFKEGEIVKSQTFVVKGCLRTYSLNDNGKEHVIMFSPEDWWCGDLYSFLSGKKSSFYADALTSTEIFQISKENIEILYKKIPGFERFFRMLFQNAFIIQQNRINANLSLNAEQRYKQFLKTYPALESQVAQKYIASYIGITPEFYSEMKARMQPKKS